MPTYRQSGVPSKNITKYNLFPIEIMPTFFRVFLFVFFCSPLFGQTFYVAPNGDDSATGTETAPFATLEKARDAARAVRQTEPVKIVLRDGTYWLPQTFTLGPEDSNTTFEAYKYEKPILSGGRLITGWKETKPGRWETTVKEVAEGKWFFEQLFVNDQRRFRATLPKNGYFTVFRGVRQGDPKAPPDRFFFGDAPFRSDWKNLNDIEVQTFHLWTMDHLRVKEVDDARKRVVFTGPTHSWDQAQLKRGTPYRIVNVYESLTEPGEWYLDRNTGVLTYLAKPGEDINKAVVIAPHLTRLVSLDGDLANDKFVEKIAFHQLTFAHTAWNMPPEGKGFYQAAVYLDGAITARVAKGISIGGCVIRHTGNYAVDFGEACKDCWVSFCELTDLGGGGVKIGTTGWGGEKDEKHWASNCKVMQSRIAHGGRLHPESIGVWIGCSPHNEVTFNDIYDFYYSTISVGWNWWPRFSPAHHNTIFGNHLHQIGQGVLNDMAGIYTLGHSPGTVLSHNVIHNVRRMDYGGWGLYYDASSRDIVSEHNVVYDTEDAGLHQNFGTDNIVRKNIFAFGENGQIRLTQKAIDGPITFEENVFYWSSPKLYEADCFDDKAIMKGNVYYRTTEPEKFRFPGDKTFDEWKQEREPDAQWIDPNFANPQKRDFSAHRFSERHIGLKRSDITVPMETPNLTASLPPVPAAFTATPKAEDAKKNFTINEGFEDFDVGELIPDLIVEAAKECSVTITDETGAAGSKKSLKFVEGADAPQPWDPHVYQLVNYREKIVAASFDWRVEKGARATFEVRDWDHSKPGYGSGPFIEFHPDGKLISLGKEILDIPHGKWFNVATTLDLKNSPERFTLTITLPDKDPQTFELPCSKKMNGVDWFGFCSFGDNGAVFYVDNLKIETR